jgi:hypothetical protein
MQLPNAALVALAFIPHTPTGPSRAGLGRAFSSSLGLRDREAVIQVAVPVMFRRHQRVVIA